MAAHRYWRVYITANNGNAYTALTEVYFATSVGGASVATGGTAINSSTGFGWVAANAFDGSTAAPGWHSGTGGFPTTPEWVGYDFGAGNSKDIVEFGICSRDAANAAAQTAKDFSLQYSDDGTTWTNQFVIVDQVGWGGFETRKFSASTTFITKKSWRLYVTATNGSLVNLTELSLRTASGAASQTTGGTASASSFYGGVDTYAPANAFDNGPNQWASNAAAPQWLQYNFTAAKDIIEYAIKAVPDANFTSTPKTFMLQYRDATGAWITADTRTNEPAWAASEVRTYTFGTANGVRPQVFACT